MNSFTLKADGKETKPFKNIEKAKKFGLAWKGKFSIFNEIQLFKNGVFVENL